MERIIMHIDVNNAFLSWTAIDLLNRGYKTDIRNLYAVIGGDEENRTGIVLAKSMKAKELGIVTAETLYSARKKCPNLQIFPPNHTFYEEMSNKLFQLLSTYTPDIEIASIDECYLDYTPIKNLYGNYYQFASKLKEEIKTKLGFTVNIGIANNKLCAKMASDFLKPDKIHTLFENEVPIKMYPLKIDKLFGVGKSTAEKLKKLNINTIKDLADSDVNTLRKYFKNQSEPLINRAKGIDNSIVDSTTWIPKGISNEITLKKDINDKNELKKYLHELSELTSQRLREQNKYTKTIGIILKDNFFKRTSKQKTIKNPTNTSNDIYKVVCEILDSIELEEKIRLIGIRLDNLTDNNTYQISLFEKNDHFENEKLEKTIDALKNKYGKEIIKTGNNLIK